MYGGDTKRTLKARLSEHIDKQWDEENPRMASQLMLNGWPLHQLGKCHSLRKVEGFWQRRTEEAIQIKKATQTWMWTAAAYCPYCYMVWGSILNPPLMSFIQTFFATTLATNTPTHNCTTPLVTHTCQHVIQNLSQTAECVRSYTWPNVLQSSCFYIGITKSNSPDVYDGI